MKGQVILHKAGDRFYEIDLFRFLAAMAVVLYHYTFRGNAADDMSILSFPMIGHPFRYGYLGVDLFFMISGFVVLLSALNRDALGFVISRVARLYPAFWVSVTLSALAIVLFNDPRFQVTFSQYVLNLSMISGFLGVDPVDGVYWSLLVELKFYLLIFVVLATGQMKHIQKILGAWLVLTLVAAIFGLPNAAEFFLFPKWSAYFIAGAMFYFIRVEGPSAYKIVVILLSYFLALAGVFNTAQILETHYKTVLYRETLVIIITLFYMMFALVSLGRMTFLNKKNFVSYGAIVYPLYLIHQNVGFMVFNAFGAEIHKYSLLMITMVTMLLISYLLHVHIEKRLAKPFRRVLNTAATYVTTMAFKSNRSA